MRLRAHILTLALLLLLVSVPILRDGTPTIVDGENHFYRAAALSWHLQHGDLYPRWFSDMHFGYGAPVLNFYSPLSYYVPTILNAIGLPLPNAMQISYILCFALAIFGAYYWARDQFESSLAGIVTAAAYSLSPFFYYNVLHRGAFPETFALGLAPWVFWATLRLARDGTRRAQLIFVVFYALLILSHNITALLVTPALWMYLVALIFKLRRNSALFAILHSSFIVIITITLCAFYFLPVYFENSYIQLWRAYSTFELDYHSQFITLTSLFAPPFTFDQLLVYNRPAISLGWFQSVLAVIAITYAIIQRRENKFLFIIIIISAFTLMLFIFFTLSISTPLWDLSPLSRPIQFPSRLVGPASLFLALLAGYGAITIKDLTRQSEPLIANIVIASFFFFSLSWTYHNRFQSLPNTVEPADIIRYEIATGQIGTTTMGEFLPVWVTETPAPDSLLAHYANDSIPNRLAALPEGVTCQAVNVKLNEEEVKCESLKDFRLTFNRFYFPSWVASLDNKSVDITPSQPQGLITLNVPSGQHTIKIFLQPTLPQVVGALISLLSLVLLFATSHQPSATSQSPIIPRRTSHAPTLTSLFILSLFITRVVYLDRYETIFHRTRLHSLPNPASINFGDQLNLIGFEYSPTTISGGALNIHLYWQIIPPVNVNYSASLQLADHFGNRFGQSDNQNISGVGTSVWSPEKYGRDTHSIKSFSGTPPGEYRLLLKVYDGTHLLNVMRDGSPSSVEYEIGKVIIERGATQPKGELRLVEGNVARRDLFVGDSFAFTTLWHSGDKPTNGVAATVSFTDSQNKLVSVKDFPITGIDYTPDKWNRNELIRYPQAIIVPPDLAAGAYRVGITLNNGARFDLGEVKINVPARSFVIPIMSRIANHDFNNAIRLLGYDVRDDSIVVYWQSKQVVEKRLTVFVHKFESGVFVSGHDASPARPTTSWIVGEVITDVHPIGVGDSFEIGLYDPLTGERFGEVFVVKP